ncbi:stromal membrane-associated protein [Paragonimus westermani]|uniref:Stromal membrane-associated protein n=1 Tax=Paragonimus westermani TaxID=34504 RepID=A0A5J4NEJ5_9TREM|nr:stromal membrane-associated protein [Paragonimus westermani]
MMDYRLELMKLVREPSNSFCADCGEPRTCSFCDRIMFLLSYSGPLWASWNLGVFLCLRCAALHRKLGTHVSKVKSLQLDSWTSVQFQTLSQSSNVQSRRIFEATLPESFIRPEKEAALEAFIRAKYERKAFVRSSSGKNLQTPTAETDQKISSNLPQESSITPTVRLLNSGAPNNLQSQYLHQITQQLAAIKAEKLSSPAPFS